MLSQHSFLVIGQGSIGQRHARLLSERGKVSTVSSSAEGSFKTIADALAIGTYTHAFVANVTSSHAAAVSELVSSGFSGHVLIEKPVCSQSDKIDQLLKASKSLQSACVGYNLRFHPAIRSLRKSLQGKRIIEARLSVGQLLSDWRPGTDFREGSSARLSAGGGALRDLSHEIDLALLLFGPWKRVVSFGGNFQRLGIETDEAWSIIIETQGGAMLSILMNYFDRPGHRTISVTADDQSYAADLVAGVLTTGETTERFELDRDYTYKSLHRDFIEQAGEACSLIEGIEVVRLIEAIEQSCAQRKWIEA